MSNRAVKAALIAADQVDRSRREIVAALERQLEAACYEASLAARRYELVDPGKRQFACELKARWHGALEHVAQLEQKRYDLTVDWHSARSPVQHRRPRRPDGTPER